MADKTVDFEGVEILAVGTWHGAAGGKQTYTRADLDEFAAAAAAIEAAGLDSIKVTLGGKLADVAVGAATIGHNDFDADGNIVREAPVIGRLSRIRREGDRLLADIVGVPARLARAVRWAYPDRSVEALRLRIHSGFEVAGQTFRQAITGLALLGDSLPAVKGLADLPRLAANADDGGEWVVFAAVDASGDAPLDPTDLDRFLAALEALFAQYQPLVYGRKGGPRARALFSAFVSDVRASARASLADGGTMDRAKLVTALALADGADDMAIMAALRATPTDAVRDALIALAAGAGISSADAFVGWLVGLLAGQGVQVAMGDLNALASAVAEKLGAGAAAPAEPMAPADGATGAGGMAPMSANTNGTTTVAATSGPPVVTDVTALSAKLDRMSVDYSAALARVAALEGKNARDAAIALVDDAISKGKFVPAQRDTLVKLAEHSPDTFKALEAGQPVVVKLGERGARGDGVAADAYQPSDADVAAMVRLGYTPAAARDLLTASNRADAGLPPVPNRS